MDVANKGLGEIRGSNSKREVELTRDQRDARRLTTPHVRFWTYLYMSIRILHHNLTTNHIHYTFP
jgi:hypothetical protein